MKPLPKVSDPIISQHKMPTVTSFIDRLAANYARRLFLYSSFAFNANHVSKLISQFHHLDSAVTEWICSFLSNRLQRTMVDSILSQPIMTNTGPPQGSVLSPLLFSICTDWIPSSLSNVTFIKYDDDTCIIAHHCILKYALFYFLFIFSSQCCELIISPEYMCYMYKVWLSLKIFHQLRMIRCSVIIVESRIMTLLPTLKRLTGHYPRVMQEFINGPIKDQRYSYKQNVSGIDKYSLSE